LRCCPGPASCLEASPYCCFCCCRPCSHTCLGVAQPHSAVAAGKGRCSCS
jgi:hypothetical protein